MKCPYCAAMENRVIDSRLSANGEVTRRRRECEKCTRRYTTYERVEGDAVPLIVKKDHRREPFDRQKLLQGIRRACEKRPISTEQLDTMITEIERDLVELGEQEVQSSVLGERVMARLRALDQVAYVRFASVYRSFDDVGAFLAELERLATPAATTPATTPAVSQEVAKDPPLGEA